MSVSQMVFDQKTWHNKNVLKGFFPEWKCSAAKNGKMQQFRRTQPVDDESEFKTK
jgi:hypothetical protein